MKQIEIYDIFLTPPDTAFGTLKTSSFDEKAGGLCNGKCQWDWKKKRQNFLQMQVKFIMSPGMVNKNMGNTNLCKFNISTKNDAKHPVLESFHDFLCRLRF